MREGVLCQLGGWTQTGLCECARTDRSRLAPPMCRVADPWPSRSWSDWARFFFFCWDGLSSHCLLRPLASPQFVVDFDSVAFLLFEE